MAKKRPLPKLAKQIMKQIEIEKQAAVFKEVTVDEAYKFAIDNFETTKQFENSDKLEEYMKQNGYKLDSQSLDKIFFGIEQKKKESVVPETPAPVVEEKTADKIDKFWVVTKPTNISTLADILFESHLSGQGGMEYQFLGGLKGEDIVGVFSKYEEAKAVADTLLADIKKKNPKKELIQEELKEEKKEPVKEEVKQFDTVKEMVSSIEGEKKEKYRLIRLKDGWGVKNFITDEIVFRSETQSESLDKFTELINKKEEKTADEKVIETDPETGKKKEITYKTDVEYKEPEKRTVEKPTEVKPADEALKMMADKLKEIKAKKESVDKQLDDIIKQAEVAKEQKAQELGQVELQNQVITRTKAIKDYMDKSGLKAVDVGDDILQLTTEVSKERKVQITKAELVKELKVIIPEAEEAIKQIEDNAMKVQTIQEQLTRYPKTKEEKGASVKTADESTDIMSLLNDMYKQARGLFVDIKGIESQIA